MKKKRIFLLDTHVLLWLIWGKTPKLKDKKLAFQQRQYRPL